MFRAHRLIPRSIPATEGINTLRLAQLLVEATRYCWEELDIDLRITRPLLKRPRVGIVRSVNLLREELETPGTALVMGFGGLDHWSVVRAITDHHLVLHDSSGRKYLRTRRCRMSYEPAGRSRPITIIRGATFALRRL
jgi:hypothetical protein